MDAKERARLIGQYRDGYREVMEALKGITEDELDHSTEDGWTPRQIAHHLADSELIAATRIRFLLALQNPTIQGYDQEEFANKLKYSGPIEQSLDALRLMRETTVPLLERMTDEDWSRAGTHTERGRWTPEDWLQLHAPHAHDHAAQIRRARGKQ